MPPTSYTDDWPRPTQILKYFQRMSDALSALRAQVDSANPQENPYFGLTMDELDKEFAELLRELEHEVVMLLAASFEAMFQVDLRRRVRPEGPNTEITKRLREFWQSKKKAKYIPVETILDVWKKAYPEHRNAIGQLNQLFQFRHWLAHGRYWPQKSGLTDVTPMGALAIGRELLNRLPDMRL